MMQWLLKLLGVDPLGKLLDSFNRAQEAKLRAANDEQRIKADIEIERIGALLEQHRVAADVVKTGMQNKLFWIPWLIATVPTTAWYGWGMMDSLFNGALPDVAALPPQLKEYADVAWANLFYAGGAVRAVEAGATILKGRK